MNHRLREELRMHGLCELATNPTARYVASDDEEEDEDDKKGPATGGTHGP